MLLPFYLHSSSYLLAYYKLNHITVELEKARKVMLIRRKRMNAVSVIYIKRERERDVWCIHLYSI